MQSKARVAGHSIHPMLVGFPISFYTATLASLIAYLGTGETYWYRTALLANVIGVVCAIVVSIPGVIDLFGLPRRSMARQIGIEHASAQLFATGLFAAGAVVLGGEWSTRTMVEGRYVLDGSLPLVFVGLGFITMILGSALGRSLIQTHRVRVDPVHSTTDRITVETADNGTDFLDDVPTQPLLPSHRAQLH